MLNLTHPRNKIISLFWKWNYFHESYQKVTTARLDSPSFIYVSNNIIQQKPNRNVTKSNVALLSDASSLFKNILTILTPKLLCLYSFFNSAFVVAVAPWQKIMKHLCYFSSRLIAHVHLRIPHKIRIQTICRDKCTIKSYMKDSNLKLGESKANSVENATRFVQQKRQHFSLQFSKNIFLSIFTLLLERFGRI